MNADTHNLRGVTLRDHPTILAVFREDTATMLATFAAIDVLLRAFGEDSTGVVVEPFVDPECSHAPVRLFVMAQTRLGFAEADALVSKAFDEWQTLEHAACDRVTLGMEFVL